MVFQWNTVQKDYNYIRTNVLRRNPFHVCQNAYRHLLMDVLGDAINTKEIFLCAFLDIEVAFDKTSHVVIQRNFNRQERQRRQKQSDLRDGQKKYQHVT